MQKSKIEWTDYSVNPVKGICPMACPYCYARRMYKRYHWEERLTYHDEVFAKMPLKPSRIFVGSTIDLFHEATIGVFPQIMSHVRQNPQHTFIFLTKCPQNLPREWPDNCWVGVSVTNFEQFALGLDYLNRVKATVKFFSFEPLLERIASKAPYTGWTMARGGAEDFKTAGISWLIFGQQTPVKASTSPQISWVREIVEAADKAHIPVFLKNNLENNFINSAILYPWAFDKNGNLRQELPRGRVSIGQLP